MYQIIKMSFQKIYLFERYRNNPVKRFDDVAMLDLCHLLYTKHL